MSEGGYYYNVATGHVEKVERKGQAKDLMGPYPTHEAAARALESARARTEAWEREDAEEEA